MRIRGAAGSEHDMQIRGAASRDQYGTQLNSTLHQGQSQPYDPAYPGLLQSSSSQSSNRARSSSISEQQAVEGKLAKAKHNLQSKDEQLKQQQQIIARLTSERQGMSTNIENLSEIRDRLTEQLENAQRDAQTNIYHDPDLARRRQEMITEQSKKLRNSDQYIKDLQAQVRKLGQKPLTAPAEELLPSSSTLDLQGIAAPIEPIDTEDDLEALDFPDVLDLQELNWVTPVERRIQALGRTMEENDHMESHQPVIVSKYFRNTREATWSKHIDQTAHWHQFRDDPAFSQVDDGAIITFEGLYQGQQLIASSHRVDQDYQNQPYWQADDDQYGGRAVSNRTAPREAPFEGARRTLGGLGS